MSLSQRIRRRLQDWLGVTELYRSIGAQPPKNTVKVTHGTGKVVTVSKKSEYVPYNGKRGGRVVKIIPAELKQIKQGQEDVAKI